MQFTHFHALWDSTHRIDINQHAVKRVTSCDILNVMFYLRQFRSEYVTNM